jgi:hypothetical protein
MSVLQEVLEHVALPSRSTPKKGFYDRSRLDAIDMLLTGSSYRQLAVTKHMALYGKVKPQELGDTCPVLVSSHADIVPSIKAPSTSLENGIYHGTYDNMGTNAAAVTLMLEEGETLPDNVYFAFTDEEETGACCGAEDALGFLVQTSGKHPFCMALDVTYEGFGQSVPASIEGLSGSAQACQDAVDAYLSTEGEHRSAVSVPHDRKRDEVSFPEAYDSGGFYMFDEGAWYGRHGCDSVSFCLPCSGSMHSDSGVDVKEAVFEGYWRCLGSFLYAFTRTCPERVEAFKAEKDRLILEARQTALPRKQGSLVSHGWDSGIWAEDEYEEEDDFQLALDTCAELAKNYSAGDAEQKLFLEQASRLFEGMEYPEKELIMLFNENHRRTTRVASAPSRQSAEPYRWDWDVVPGMYPDDYLETARDNVCLYPPTAEGKNAFLHDAAIFYRTTRIAGPFPEEMLMDIFREEQEAEEEAGMEEDPEESRMPAPQDYDDLDSQELYDMDGMDYDGL